ncbi:MAG: zinc-dependent metalloprotease [Chitinophagaceae bacterium]|nr:zinc-dependent metalloprotease [Chitinophagaceae bacterium]
MRKHVINAVMLLTLTAVIYSCQKKTSSAEQKISPEVISQLQHMGFSTDGVEARDGGYLVEGDLFIPTSDLGKTFNSPTLLVANEEQYRTTNLVNTNGGVRNITVSLNTNLSYFVQATQAAISRYNAENLQLTFTLVPGTSADINIVTFYQVSNTLGSSGFPSGGNPYNNIQMNTYWYSASTDINYLASIIAHEMGHCIGFRHTDYMNRAYSCGGRRSNEGTAGVGAILIPGTPSAADPNSWMLACIGSGVNRPFNANDKIALSYLY